MVKIAIEQPFTDIQQVLQQRGYQADMIDQKSEGASYDVVVVRNVESYEGVQTQGSLVETSGRTVIEVVQEVEERLQRAGKTLAPKQSITSPSLASDTVAAGGGGFVTGLLTGAVVGAATALLLAPKSGKEMQKVVKDKVASTSSGEGGSGKLSQVKEKAAGIAGQVKDKVGSSSGEGGSGKLSQVKSKVTDIADQAKGKVSELKEKKQGQTTDTSSTSTTKTPSTVVTTDSLNTSSTSGTTGTSGTTAGGTSGITGASGASGGSGTQDTLNTSGTSGTRGGSGTSGTTGTSSTSGTKNNLDSKKDNK
ncbi:YkuS family protein [Planococcus sp. N028]|uniref:YkuS family protein n=1 Tax=Planococcus shixiaomingii TaxID=3058393 RepID=A0ABT8N3P0_9BACL|nr:YkuS family protein [Planococcus sp. N028]MDN7242500.1 YkuS family protein [Planococcus sp. N028]